MSTIADQIKNQFKQGDNLTRLIILNISVFVLVIVAEMISFLVTGSKSAVVGFIQTWFALSSDAFTFITRPWTLFTYMFLHAGFFHLFFNLLILYFSGRIFMEYLGHKRLLAVFVYGGLAGGMLFFVLYNISPAFTAGAPLVGASAGVVAVLVAVATFVPNMPVRLFFIIEVKLWIVAALAVLSYVAGVTGSNAGGNLAHLGGAALGFLFINAYKKGNDWSIGFDKMMDGLSNLFAAKPKLTKVYSSGSSRTNSVTNSKSATFVGSQKDDQKRVDDILDKISKSGYEKLTKDEKEFLFKFGKK